MEAVKHFFGVREAFRKLIGIAIFDRLEQELSNEFSINRLTGFMWNRREIENYLCSPESLEAFARSTGEKEAFGPLFASTESERRIEAMRACIAELRLNSFVV